MLDRIQHHSYSKGGMLVVGVDGTYVSKTNYSPTDVQSQGGLATLKGDKTVNELASQFVIHSNLIYRRKRVLLESAIGIFDGPASKKDSHDHQHDVAELFEQIGWLKMEWK